jgi:hypothetical protein
VKSAWTDAVTPIATTQQTIHAGKYDPMIFIDGEKEHPLRTRTKLESLAAAIICRSNLMDCFLSGVALADRLF